ncbi:hypothetical protein BpHYR1_032502 [Brachionus plicatilis]|uniref:Uncharacterized protein n=1 Tax=Brachionus plicatilis TaxID=10195 RepID=A0A3M7Q4T5_BRAPC|nr:hypothetical protein BpHYR1_032502 [Brachionus plicatilis]
MSKQKKDVEVECNLENELSQDDEFLLKKINLTQEQIKLKTENQEAFWKIVAETLRSDLKDALDDNQELHRLKDLMEEEGQDLDKENTKLVKLVNEAKEICNQYIG